MRKDGSVIHAIRTDCSNSLWNGIQINNKSEIANRNFYHMYHKIAVTVNHKIAFTVNGYFRTITEQCPIYVKVKFSRKSYLFTSFE